MAHRIVEPQKVQVRLPRRPVNVRIVGVGVDVGTMDRMNITEQDREKHIAAIGRYMCYFLFFFLPLVLFLSSQRSSLHRGEHQEPTATANPATFRRFQPVLGADGFHNLEHGKYGLNLNVPSRYLAWE